METHTQRACSLCANKGTKYRRKTICRQLGRALLPGDTESLSVELHKWSLTTFCCKYACLWHFNNNWNAKWSTSSVGACKFVCVSVCVCESCVNCALAFTAVPRYHESTSVSVSSGSTSSWSSHKLLHFSPSSKRTGSWRGKRGKVGRRETVWERVEVRGSVKWVVKFYS